MRKKLLVVAFLLLATFSYATTYYATCSCQWTTAAMWSTSPSLTNPVTWGSLTINAGDVIEIDGFNVTITSSFTITLMVTINLVSTNSGAAGLTFQNGKKLTLTSSSTVINFTNNSNNGTADPSLTGGGGGGNSNYIKIGGNTVWQAGDGNVTGTGQLNSGSTGGTLPIVLTSFHSSTQGDIISLEWSTSSEINFDYFSVQKSTNGSDFTEIAQVKGNGTTSVGHNYKYEDTNPFIGKNYYRLTSVDFDNYRQTFKVVEQDYVGTKDLYISYSADRSVVDIVFNFESTAGVLTIFDNVGYPVGSYAVTGVGSINLSDHLKSGIYVAKYSSSAFSKALRFAIK